MSLNIEYLNRSFHIKSKGSITVDDRRRGLYIRSYKDQESFYISLSTDKPEEIKNFPGSRQIGFYFSPNDNPIIENFAGRKSIIPIKISAR